MSMTSIYPVPYHSQPNLHVKGSSREIRFDLPSEEAMVWRKLLISLLKNRTETLGHQQG